MNFMKKIIMGLCLLSATTMMYARDTRDINTPERNVPMSVKGTFHKNYPDANGVRWTYTEGRWNANFRKMEDNTAMTACYDAKGRHIDSRLPVAQNAVPAKVIHRLNEKYPGQYTHSFTKIERVSKRDLYRVKVKQQGVYKNLYLDKRGHEKEYASR